MRHASIGLVIAANALVLLSGCGSDSPVDEPGSGGTGAAGSAGAMGGQPSGGSAGVGGSAGAGGNAGSGLAAGQAGAAGNAGTAGAGSGGSAGDSAGGASGAGIGGASGAGAGGAAGGGQSNGGSAGQSSDCGDHEGFWVDGRLLRDRCCEKVVLRGVNEMVVWTGSQDGSPYFAEIAQTGANAVRIVWETAGPVAKLDAAIQNALDHDLIPIPELHDATGDLSKLNTCVDYWVRSDVVAVLDKYKNNLIVNIANEVGDHSVSEATFTSSYQEAVSRMRAAGIHVPLVIDAPGWGQNIDVVQAAGPALIDSDPDRNLLFSVHMWWNDPQGSRVTTELNESVGANLPLIVGEFAQHAVSNCAQEPFAYKTLLSLAKMHEIGWLAWSWGGVNNSDCQDDGPFDMSPDGTYANLTDWGLEVARTDPNSIQNTSVRPGSIVNGSCN